MAIDKLSQAYQKKKRRRRREEGEEKRNGNEAEVVDAVARLEGWQSRGSNGHPGRFGGIGGDKKSDWRKETREARLPGEVQWIMQGVHICYVLDK